MIEIVGNAGASISGLGEGVFSQNVSAVPEPGTYALVGLGLLPSQSNEFFPGDFVNSGTPERVGLTVRGDVDECHIDRLSNLKATTV